MARVSARQVPSAHRVAFWHWLPCYPIPSSSLLSRPLAHLSAMRFSTVIALLAATALPVLSAPAHPRGSAPVSRPATEDVSGAIALAALAHALSNSDVKQARTTSQRIEKVSNNINNLSNIVNGITTMVDTIHSTVSNFMHHDDNTQRDDSLERRTTQLRREQLMAQLLARAMEQLD